MHQSYLFDQCHVTTPYVKVHVTVVVCWLRKTDISTVPASRANRFDNFYNTGKNESDSLSRQPLCNVFLYGYGAVQLGQEILLALSVPDTVTALTVSDGKTVC